MDERSHGQLLQIDAKTGSIRSGKVSELLLEYAAPLLDVEGGLDITALRNLLNIACLCWNAAWYVAQGDHKLRQLLSPIVERAPAEIRTILEDLLRDRMTRYGSVGILLDVEVEGDAIESARVIARAYQPRQAGGSGAGEALASPAPQTLKIGANDRCPCGSGRKYKKCCRQ